MDTKDFVIENGTLAEYVGQGEAVIIPNGVTVIGQEAFRNCRNLTNITIPDSVRKIDHNAFRDCSSLISIVIPSKVTFVGWGAFMGCSSLINITLPDCLTEFYDNFEECTSLQRIQTHVLPLSRFDARLKFAMVNAFVSNPAEYPEERKAEYLKYLNAQKKRCLSQAVTTENIAFMSGYEQLKLPWPPTLRDELIELATKEKKVISAAWLLEYTKRTADPQQEAQEKQRLEEQQFDNPYMAKFLKSEWVWEDNRISGTWKPDGTKCIVKYKGNDTIVVIPPVIGRSPVTSIADGTFEDKTMLTSVIIPDGVTRMSQCLFSGCSNLTNVVIPDGVTHIDARAFYDCTSLTSVAIPDGVTHIDTRAFQGCTSLTSVVIPDGVTYIGTSAFKNCTSLQSIIVPDSVTDICADAFANTPWLAQQEQKQEDFIIAGTALVKYKGNQKHVVIPSGVTCIGGAAFKGCSQLESVMIPDSVVHIGSYAFYKCISLTEVALPDGVISIGGGAFEECSALPDIIIPEGVTDIGMDTFKSCQQLKHITIPSSITYISESAFDDCKKLKAVTFDSQPVQWLRVGWALPAVLSRFNFAATDEDRAVVLLCQEKSVWVKWVIRTVKDPEAVLAHIIPSLESSWRCEPKKAKRICTFMQEKLDVLHPATIREVLNILESKGGKPDETPFLGILLPEGE